jgi:hypothetical protein
MKDFPLLKCFQEDKDGGGIGVPIPWCCGAHPPRPASIWYRCTKEPFWTNGQKCSSLTNRKDSACMGLWSIQEENKRRGICTAYSLRPWERKCTLAGLFEASIDSVNAKQSQRNRTRSSWHTWYYADIHIYNSSPVTLILLLTAAN